MGKNPFDNLKTILCHVNSFGKTIVFAHILTHHISWIYTLVHSLNTNLFVRYQHSLNVNILPHCISLLWVYVCVCLLNCESKYNIWCSFTPPIFHGVYCLQTWTFSHRSSYHYQNIVLVTVYRWYSVLTNYTSNVLCSKRKLQLHVLHLNALSFKPPLIWTVL